MRYGVFVFLRWTMAMVALGYIFNDGFSGLHEDVCPEVE